MDGFDNLSKDDIIQLYKTPGHPIAFSNPRTAYEFFNGRFPLKLFKDAYESIHSYSLHREFKKPKQTNPFYSIQRRTNFQADLIDISELKKTNDNVRFLMLIIDIFSRKIWLIPMVNKTAAASVEAWEQWVDSIENDSNPQKTIFTDRGGEFTAQAVKDFFDSHNMKHSVSKSVNKAAIAERSIKTIEVLIYKYLTDSGESRYIDKLAAIIHSYNNRVHRSIHPFTPNQADLKENEKKVRSIQLRRFSNINEKRRKPKYKIGDVVRIKSYAQRPSRATRAYAKQFNDELFKIQDINVRMPIPMYFLESMDSGELIEGGFYANELSPIRSNTFKIEKILKRRGRGENEEVLVRWKYFSNRWDSWVKASEIRSNDS